MESVKELGTEIEINLRPISYKNYFNDYMNIKELIRNYILIKDDYTGMRSSSFKELEEEYIKKILPIKILKPIDRLKAKHFRNFLSDRFFNEIEVEINQVSKHFDELKENSEDFDISEEIWSYSKKILMNIHNRYLFRYSVKIPTPKIIFIENAIEIEWESDSFKLILRISDFIKDVSVYLRDKTGPPMHSNVRRDRIVDWVVFWLDQFLNS